MSVSELPARAPRDACRVAPAGPQALLLLLLSRGPGLPHGRLPCRARRLLCAPGPARGGPARGGGRRRGIKERDVGRRGGNGRRTGGGGGGGKGGRGSRAVEAMDVAGYWGVGSGGGGVAVRGGDRGAGGGGVAGRGVKPL